MKTLNCRTHWMKNKTSLEKDDFAIQQHNNGNRDSQSPQIFKVLIKSGFICGESNHCHASWRVNVLRVI